MGKEKDNASLRQLEELQESERMYRNLIERSNDGVVVLQDRLIKFVNSRFCDMSGYSADTLLDTTFTEYLTPEEIALLAERYEKRMAGEQVQPIYETVMTRSNGSKIPLEVSAAVVPFQGRPADLVLVRDVTERKVAEEYLQKYRLLAESTDDILVFAEPDGTIVEANRAALEAHGYSREDLLGMNLASLKPEAERAAVAARLECAQSGSTLFESTNVRKDGTSYPVEVRLSGALIGGKPMVLGIARDITKRKSSEAALESERRRLQALLDALPIAVIIADAEGRITDANEQANVVWGGPVPYVGDVKHYDAYKGWWPSGEPIRAEDWAMARALTTGETVVGEMVHIQRFDGECGTILNSAAPIRNSEGQITGGVVTIQDISEIVELREALERSLEETKRENRRAEALQSIAEAGLSIPRLPDLLETMVERIAEALDADASCIFVLNEQTKEFEAQAAYNVPGLLGCSVAANEGLIGRVAAEQRPVSIADAEHDPRAFDNCETRIVAKSMLGVPMIARGRVVGVTRVQSLVTRDFTEDDIRLLEAIADRAALAVDNAKLYDDLQSSRSNVQEALDTERHFSLVLQRALLPRLSEIGNGYSFAVRYEPVFAGREVGGDFYDVFRAGDGWAGVVIGDVSGKGLEAASLAAATRSTIHAFTHEIQHTGQILTRANSVLHRQQPDQESFVTVSVLTIELSTGKMHYSSAGHPPVAIVRADGRVESLHISDLPLGVLPSHDYQTSIDCLCAGDKLVVYTDGISEARSNGAMLDIEGIEKVLTQHAGHSAEGIANALTDAATQWADGKLRDDAAVVVFVREG